MLAVKETINFIKTILYSVEYKINFLGRQRFFAKLFCFIFFLN